MSLHYLRLYSVHKKRLSSPTGDWPVRIFRLGVKAISSNDIKNMAGKFVQISRFGLTDDSDCFVFFNFEVVFGFKF